MVLLPILGCLLYMEQCSMTDPGLADEIAREWCRDPRLIDMQQTRSIVTQRHLVAKKKFDGQN